MGLFGEEEEVREGWPPWPELVTGLEGLWGVGGTFVHGGIHARTCSGTQMNRPKAHAHTRAARNAHLLMHTPIHKLYPRAQPCTCIHALDGRRSSRPTSDSAMQSPVSPNPHPSPLLEEEAEPRSGELPALPCGQHTLCSRKVRAAGCWFRAAPTSKGISGGGAQGWGLAGSPGQRGVIRSRSHTQAAGATVLLLF